MNHSTPGAYQDQAAGYYTGGGYVMRQGNTSINPINISLPRFGIGCNSIDLYFGSFSFMKGDELVKLARQLATGIPTYAFQLFLKTKAPQIENLVAQLRKVVQDLNGMMLNSCEASQQIVDGLWPKETAANEHLCKLKTQGQGGNNDWYAARNQCSKPGFASDKVNNLRNETADLLVGEYNLVWHVLKKMPDYRDNAELASFIMSVTGTLISKRDGDRYRLKIIEPRADQKDFIGAYLKGGATSKLVCDESNKCLAPYARQVTIEDHASSAQPTMKAKVMEKIRHLREKYISKGSITDEEIGFLNDSVNLPVYKYIQVSVAAGTQFMMQDTAEYIAAGVLLTQFDRVMTEVIEAIDALQKIQLEDTAIAQFKQNLQQARGRVQSLLIGANNGSLYNFNQTIEAIERSIIARNT
ncbi:conjugal transfer protein TraH [Candidatus Odyssella thessalonicensis]|uniref:conjugal transfer protein TraH n=1 Tax=Candidatus Odyssella thessalonicensis TaxID=84647 RepID=UPI000225A9D9|nr:conjugal transfer protein TraH [Candidatus Odyssella thessalonicensis]